MLNPTGQASYFYLQHAQTGKLLGSTDGGTVFLQSANINWFPIWKWDGTCLTYVSNGKMLLGGTTGVYTDTMNNLNIGNKQIWSKVFQNGTSKLINQGTNLFLDADASGNLLLSSSDKLKFPVWNYINGWFVCFLCIIDKFLYPGFK